MRSSTLAADAKMLSVVFFLLIAESAPHRSLAQSSRESAADFRLRNTIIDIKAHDPSSVRLSSGATGRLEGRRVSLVGDSVVVATDSGARAIALASIDSVWTQRSAAPILGIIAAVPCAIFGGMVGSFIGGDPDSNGSPRREAIGTILGILGGGAICGTVGAAVGSLIPRWQLEYVRMDT